MIIWDVYKNSTIGGRWDCLTMSLLTSHCSSVHQEVIIKAACHLQQTKLLYVRMVHGTLSQNDSIFEALDRAD